ncbi:MAG: ABC transporter substrate-binding protein [Kiloniellales bacterium]|nr:ABC transporter substrate-binding protein [Kiloniellales bacterium]
MSEEISIEFTRFSAFYSPLIATIAGGFLEEEGLKPKHAVAPPNKSAIAALLDGSAHVVQSALSQGFGPLERGETPPVVHFAQINEMDGFFIAGRRSDPDFTWNKLTSGKVLVDHGGQPLAMFKYACLKRGVDFAAIDAVDAGDVQAMDAAFRAGEGDYIHQQGPAPQQLEHDGVGHVLASVGEAIGPCGFSSLAATREWLDTNMARAFMRAYRKARRWLTEVPAGEVAALEARFFPEIAPEALTRTIAFYQQLGCWTPHVEITKSAYDVTVDVFLKAGRITAAHPYAAIVVSPPE